MTRAAVENGILNIEFFAAVSVRLQGKTPRDVMSRLGPGSAKLALAQQRHSGGWTAESNSSRASRFGQVAALIFFAATGSSFFVADRLSMSTVSFGSSFNRPMRSYEPENLPVIPAAPGENCKSMPHCDPAYRWAGSGAKGCFGGMRRPFGSMQGLRAGWRWGHDSEQLRQFGHIIGFFPSVLTCGPDIGLPGQPAFAHHATELCL